MLASARGAEVDPVYWRTLITLTHELGLGDVRVVARRGLALHADPEIARTAAPYLLPKWGGSMTTYRQWAEEAARLTAQSYGDVLYMWLAYQAWFGAEDEFPKAKFDWNRIRKGHEALIKMAPKLVPSHHRYAAMTRAFNDRATAKAQFQKAELAWYEGAEGIWKQRSNYDATRTWATAADVEPFVDTPPPGAPAVQHRSTTNAPAAPAIPLAWPFTPLSQWPQILLASRFKAGPLQFSGTGFLVETSTGIVAVSAVPDRQGRPDNENRIREIVRDLSSWTLAPPSDPKQVMHVTPMGKPAPVHYQLGVALALQPRSTPFPVRALKLAPATVEPSGRVLVLACGWVTHACKQMVLEGTVTSRDIGSTGFQQIHIGIQRKLNPRSLIGAAVLTEEGHVVGVVTDRQGSRSAGAAMTLTADDVRWLVKR